MRNGDYQDIDAAVTIDATGNGLIADMAGCEYMFGSEAKSDYNEPHEKPVNTINIGGRFDNEELAVLLLNARGYFGLFILFNLWSFQLSNAKDRLP